MSLIHESGEIVNPIQMMPCHPGWKAVFESDIDDDFCIYEEDVVMWGLFEYHTTCTISGEDEPHSMQRQPNFVAGLIRDEFSEGGLKAARPSDGLIGYRSPGESLDDFLRRMNVTMEDFEKKAKPLVVEGLLN